MIEKIIQLLVNFFSKPAARLGAVFFGFLASNGLAAWLVRRYEQKKAQKKAAALKKTILKLENEIREIERRISAGMKSSRSEKKRLEQLRQNRDLHVEELQTVQSSEGKR